MAESQGEQEPHLGEREDDQSGRMGGKSGLHREGRQVPRWGGSTGKKSLSRRSSRKHERVRGRKSSSGRSAEFWFHTKFGQT